MHPRDFPERPLVSERDVVFTPFMLRVRATLDGTDTGAPPRLEPSRPRSRARAVDDWFALRARAEQVVAEANAMGAGVPVVDLEDEVGTGELAFVLRVGPRWARLALRLSGREGWVDLRRNADPPGGPMEPADLAVLEDLIIDLLSGKGQGNAGQ
jgi:hypothetical protein